MAFFFKLQISKMFIWHHFLILVWSAHNNTKHNEKKITEKHEVEYAEGDIIIVDQLQQTLTCWLQEFGDLFS